MKNGKQCSNTNSLFHSSTSCDITCKHAPAHKYCSKFKFITMEENKFLFVPPPLTTLPRGYGLSLLLTVFKSHQSFVFQNGCIDCITVSCCFRTIISKWRDTQKLEFCLLVCHYQVTGSGIVNNSND